MNSGRLVGVEVWMPCCSATRSETQFAQLCSHAGEIGYRLVNFWLPIPVAAQASL